MLVRLGSGHTPEEAGKQGQQDLGATGSLLAEEVLLAALRQIGRCIDCEAWPGTKGEG